MPGRGSRTSYLIKILIIIVNGYKSFTIRPEEVCMKKGAITVFLSLILTMILSLVSAVIESVRVSAIRARIEMCTDMGLYSIFAEYNRELLKNYDLYFIDTSYGTSTPSLANTTEHLKDYLRYNFEPSKGQFSIGTVDFTGLSVGNVTLEMPSYASDNAGRVFKRQAIHSVKDRFGLSIINKAVNNYKSYKNSGIEETDVDEEREKIQEKLKDIDWDEADNPADKVFDKRAGILNLIMKSLPRASDKELALENCASHRSLTKGVGIVRPDSDPDSMVNEFFFNEYLVWKCSSYTKDLKHPSMSYELEYILNGKNTDTANLRKTVETLLLTRAAADTIVVMKDDAKKSQAKLTAEIISALLFLPEIAEPLEKLILLAWGFAEGVVDVRTLLKGGRVPLMKSSPEFSIKTIAQLPLFMTMTGKNAENSGGGLSYADYLRIFLALENKSKKVMRAMDVIELYMRTTEGNSAFRMDGCIEYIQADIEAVSRFGYEYSIRRDFAYEAIIE